MLKIVLLVTVICMTSAERHHNSDKYIKEVFVRLRERFPNEHVRLFEILNLIFRLYMNKNMSGSKAIGYYMQMYEDRYKFKQQCNIATQDVIKSLPPIGMSLDNALEINPNDYYDNVSTSLESNPFRNFVITF